jgi:hypothetical protein
MPLVRLFGAASEANADRTVLRDTFITPSDHLDRQPLRPMQPTNLSPVLHGQHPFLLPADQGQETRKGVVPEGAGPVKVRALGWLRPVLRGCRLGCGQTSRRVGVKARPEVDPRERAWP